MPSPYYRLYYIMGEGVKRQTRANLKPSLGTRVAFEMAIPNDAAEAVTPELLIDHSDPGSGGSTVVAGGWCASVITDGWPTVAVANGWRDACSCWEPQGRKRC
jgi:hypothetical protein